MEEKMTRVRKSLREGQVQEKRMEQALLTSQNQYKTARLGNTR